jgi:hypothetical protein
MMQRLENITFSKAAIIIAFCAVLLYLATITHPFTWNDGKNIVANQAITELANIPGFFSQAWGDVSADDIYRARNSGYWRPVTLTSFALDHAFFGLQATGFHLMNVLLHALMSVLVLRFAWRLFPSAGPQRLGVLMGVLLWTVHPVHTEIVNVVSYRSDLLAGVFYLAALLAWIGWSEQRSRLKEMCALYGWSPLFFLLGCGSKEMAVTLPLAVLLLDQFLPPRPLSWRNRVTRLVPIGVVLVGYFGLRHALLTPSGQGFFSDAPAEVVVYTMLGVFGRYVALLVNPWPLNPFYDWSVITAETTLWGVTPLMGLALLLVWLATIAWCWQRKPRVAFLMSLYLVVLIPVSQLVPVIVAAAERFLYVAAIGPLLLCPILLVQTRAKRVVWVALSVLLVVYASVTVMRSQDWKSDRAILEANVRDWPRSYNAWFGLARLHEREGRVEQAQEIYERLERTENLQQVRPQVELESP